MKRLLSIITLLFCTLGVFGQNTCALQNLSYEVIHEGDLFFFYVSDPSPEVLQNQFEIFINGEQYESGSGEYGPLLADCVTPYTIEILSRDSDFCQFKANIGPVCTDSSNCFIGEIEYSYPECTPFDSVLVEINFKHENTSESFFLKGNGISYGEYKYSELPIMVPVLSNCNREYEFVVIDARNETCSSSIGGIIICCPHECDRPEFDILSIECSNARLFMKVELFDILVGSNLTVQINEEYLSDYRIDGRFLYIETQLSPNDVLNTLTICTVGIADVCCTSQTFSTEDCQPTGECHIYNLRYDTEDCDLGDEVYIALDFKYKNTVSDSFSVRGNGNDYGLYSYGDLPVKVGPFQSACDVVYELEVRDFVQDSCLAVLEDLIICCHDDCLEPIFEIIDLECSDAEFRMKVELIHPLFSDQLRISINGDDSVSYQIDYPFVYLEYPLLNSSDQYVLEICSFNGPNFQCCYALDFDLSDCGQPNECVIGEIIVEPYPCIDTGIPGFQIDFKYENEGSEGFSVKGNGIDYGIFRYSDLPIYIPVEDNCEITYEFIVYDNEKPCRNIAEYGPYCCNDLCSFRAKEQRLKCEDGSITEVAFFLEEDTDAIKEYQVYVNGELIAELNDNNQFFEIETSIPLVSNQRPILTICDGECCVDYELEVSDCIIPPTPCSIENVVVSQVTCTDAGLNLLLDFEHKGTSSANFDVFSIFGYFGTFEYADLPLRIQNFPNANLGLNAIFICDQGSLCCQVHLFNSPFCQAFFDETDRVMMKEEKKQQSYIVQNPVNSTITLRSDQLVSSYSIFDSSGKKVVELRDQEGESTVDARGLIPGLYVVKIENEQGTTVEKLIIAK